MPQYRKKKGPKEDGLLREGYDDILFIEWLLEIMANNGNVNIENVRSTLGLTTREGIIGILQHISTNSYMYENYININLNSKSCYDNYLYYN